MTQEIQFKSVSKNNVKSREDLKAQIENERNQERKRPSLRKRAIAWILLASAGISAVIGANKLLNNPEESGVLDKSINGLKITGLANLRSSADTVSEENIIKTFDGSENEIDFTFKDGTRVVTQHYGPESEDNERTAVYIEQEKGWVYLTENVELITNDDELLDKTE